MARAKFAASAAFSLSVRGVAHVVGQRGLQRRLEAFTQEGAHQGHDGVLEGAVVELVAAVVALRVGVVLGEGGVGIGGVDRGVVRAEEAVAQVAVGRRDAVKLPALHGVEVGDGVARDAEGLGVVLAPVEEGMLARAQHLAHGGHTEGGVDADAQVAVHLGGIHAPHARTQNDVGLLALHQVGEEGQRLEGVNGDVGRDDLGRGQHLA